MFFDSDLTNNFLKLWGYHCLIHKRAISPRLSYGVDSQMPSRGPWRLHWQLLIYQGNFVIYSANLAEHVGFHTLKKNLIDDKSIFHKRLTKMERGLLFCSYICQRDHLKKIVKHQQFLIHLENFRLKWNN